MNSQNDDVRNAYKDRFLPVQRKSNWILLSLAISCRMCLEFVHEALCSHDLMMKGVKIVDSAVLADYLLVVGEFNEKELVNLWNELRHPKKIILIGDCAVKNAEKVGKFIDADIINGCPVNIDELGTILTL